MKFFAPGGVSCSCIEARAGALPEDPPQIQLRLYRYLKNYFAKWVVDILSVTNSNGIQSYC